MRLAENAGIPFKMIDPDDPIEAAHDVGGTFPHYRGWREAGGTTVVRVAADGTRSPLPSYGQRTHDAALVRGWTDAKTADESPERQSTFAPRSNRAESASSAEPGSRKPAISAGNDGVDRVKSASGATRSGPSDGNTSSLSADNASGAATRNASPRSTFTIGTDERKATEAEASGSKSFESIPTDSSSYAQTATSRSTSAFDWGTDSEESAQLALAMLADFLGDDRMALEFYQRFKARCIQNLQRDRWTLNAQQVRGLFEEVKSAADA